MQLGKDALPSGPSVCSRPAPSLFGVSEGPRPVSLETSWKLLEFLNLERHQMSSKSQLPVNRWPSPGPRPTWSCLGRAGVAAREGWVAASSPQPAPATSFWGAWLTVHGALGTSSFSLHPSIPGTQGQTWYPVSWVSSTSGSSTGQESLSRADSGQSELVLLAAPGPQGTRHLQIQCPVSSGEGPQQACLPSTVA